MNDHFHSNNEGVSRIPIIRLWNRLIVTLQGDITDRQAALLHEDVLRDIRETGARGLVIDISGMWLVDSHLCAVLAQVANSARLMGTKSVMVGMKPEVAMTLQSMGMTLKGVDTALDLEDGLARLGVTLAHSEDDEAGLLPDDLGAEPAERGDAPLLPDDLLPE